MTDENARILRTNMGVGNTPGVASHHIVPSTHHYPAAVQAREKLNSLGIDSNAKENGVLLPYEVHNGLSNNHVDMDAVRDELLQAGTKKGATEILDDIAIRLRNGSFPR